MAEPQGRKRVLIVEDASIIRAMLNKTFAAQGFDCIEVTRGEDAIKAYRDSKPDLVTLDIHMEGLSGMSVLQVLRTIDPNARIIIVSVDGDRVFIEEAIRQGAKAFVVKPFQPEALVEAVARAFE